MGAIRHFLLAAASSLAACGTLPRAGMATAYEQVLALPAPLAGAIVAEAVRAALPFADPVPYAAGAPATVGLGGQNEGHCTVRYEARAGIWVPVARHRLVRRGITITTRSATDLPGFGLGADHIIELVLRANGEHTELRGTVPAHLASAIRTAIDVAVRTFTAAAPPNLDLRAAQQLAQVGDLDRAREYRDHAALTACDPAARHHVVRSVVLLTTGAAARNRIRECLANDDLAEAMALLLTARRATPDPRLDYRLLWQLHRRQHDDDGALASALLAREHGGLDAALAAADELQRGGFGGALARLTARPPQLAMARGTQPADASHLPFSVLPQPAAMPGR